MKLLLGIKKTNQLAGIYEGSALIEGQSTEIIFKGTEAEIKDFLKECDKLGVELRSLYREQTKIEEASMYCSGDTDEDNKRWEEIDARIENITYKGGIRNNYETLLMINGEIL